MKELEMIKAFAELEGVEVEFIEVSGLCGMSASGIYRKRQRDGGGLIQIKEYNPITDLALNCAARDKYKVEVECEWDEVFINGADYATCATMFEDRLDIPKAVIECILKSKGLWVCQK